MSDYTMIIRFKNEAHVRDRNYSTTESKTIPPNIYYLSFKKIVKKLLVVFLFILINIAVKAQAHVNHSQLLIM